MASSKKREGEGRKGEERVGERRDVNQCLWEVRLLLHLGNELGLERQIQVASPMLTVKDT